LDFFEEDLLKSEGRTMGSDYYGWRTGKLGVTTGKIIGSTFTSDLGAEHWSKKK
jgi:hypothetical protein